jgi:hypothetical protein
VLSKIVGYSLVAVLALALVGGSAYILLRPAAARSGYGGGSRGWEHVEKPDGYGRGYADVNRVGRAGQGLGTGGAEHPIGTWLTVTGEVVTPGDELVIQTADGRMEVHLGPAWYWEAEGIDLSTGDEVAVLGFYEGVDFEAGHIENLTSGEGVTLRYGTRRPMWAGRGRWGH